MRASIRPAMARYGRNVSRVGFLLWALFGWGSSPVWGAECEPWPGEPAPLPSVGHSEFAPARWAQLRSRELANLAVALESEDPVAAHGLWLHLRCLDPNFSGLSEALVRTLPLRVARPPIVKVRSERMLVPAPDVKAALASLETAVAVWMPAPEAPPLGKKTVPAPDRAALNAELTQARSALQSAHFEEALRSAEKLRAALPTAESAPTARQQRAEVEVIAATAELALGKNEAARTSLARALQADPQLSLDPLTTPPKVSRALEEVRQKREGTP